MFGMMSGNGLWQLVRQSDAMSAGVLILLLVLSIFCWALFFFKLIVLRLKLRQLRSMHRELSHARSLDNLLALATRHVGTVPGYFISKVLVFLKIILESDRTDDDRHLHSHEWEMMQSHIDQSITTVMEHERSYVSVLSTSAAVGPLLGLFGTVWGLVHAFMDISEKQAADITTVAPGIAEALTTTLAGLLVAIPALVMFNIVQRHLHAVETQLEQVADHISFVIQKMVKR